jgi:hypothetical protein
MTTPPQYFMPDGMPAAPGMPFADNHEDGIYHPAGGAFGIAVNGARGVEVDNDGNLKLMVADAGLLDANGDPIGGGGGGGLTGWETDVDGNLIRTGTGYLDIGTANLDIKMGDEFAFLMRWDDGNGWSRFESNGVFSAFHMESDAFIQRGGFNDNANHPYLGLKFGNGPVNMAGMLLYAGDDLRWSIGAEGNLMAEGYGGAFGAPPGTAAWPGITFSHEQTSGISQSADFVLDFSTNGVLRWTIDADGKLIPTIANEVPATPTVQQVVDVLKALGILTQAA